MSRHRNVRTLNYDEEYDTVFDVYGQSVEEDCCISPTTAAEFIYDRNSKSNQSMSAFLSPAAAQVLEEEDEEDDDNDTSKGSARLRADSISGIISSLNQLDRAKLLSCVEEMQNVVGDTIPESRLATAAMQNHYNLEKSLAAVLSKIGEEPKPQRVIKERPPREKGSVVPKIEEEKQQIPEPPAVPSTTCVTSIQGEWISIGPDKTRETDNLPAEAEESSKSKTFLEPFERRERKSRSPSPLPNGRDPTDGAASARKSKAAQKNSSEEYAKERGSGKLLLNLVVIGHVDAGKSTLMGHLLYRLGCVTKRAMHKYEQDSKKLGKASFMYAWVLDETSEERNRGITMDVAQSKFETSQRSVTLLDAPGHKDFIPNMITGAAQADVAILVVDATRGEFETGFEAGGQTREHTVLVRSLGVSQLAVVVNKLDNVDWSEDRYKEIEAKLSTFLKQVGFKESDVFFVPCSGLTGENLTSKSDSKALSTWYKGPCLVDIIDGFKPPERPVSKPFRMCIGDIFKGTGSGFCVGGRIESGHVVAGDRLSIMPAGEVATIKSITIDEMTVPQAFAGDHVTMVLSGVDQNKVACGDVVCDSSNPIRASSRFQARVVLFNVTLPLTKGFPVVLHYQSMNEQAVVRKILTHLHKSTGEMLKKKPRCLLKNSSGEIELEVNRPICIELYKDFKDLGRFMLRSAGITIAAGMVTKISN